MGGRTPPAADAALSDAAQGIARRTAAMAGASQSVHGGRSVTASPAMSARDPPVKEDRCGTRKWKPPGPVRDSGASGRSRTQMLAVGPGQDSGGRQELGEGLTASAATTAGTAPEPAGGLRGVSDQCRVYVPGSVVAPGPGRSPTMSM